MMASKKRVNSILNQLSVFVEGGERVLVLNNGKSTSYVKDVDFIKEHNKQEKQFAIVVLIGGEALPKGKWDKIFSYGDINIFKHPHKYISGFNTGLNEKLKLVKSARKFLQEVVESGGRTEEIKGSQKIFGAGVALWKDGNLRGSHICYEDSFEKAVLAATLKAAKDFRFKPIAKNEIVDTRIQIAIISPLKIDFDFDYFRAYGIAYDKGYALQNGNKIGWLLPEIFNISKFKTVDDFLNFLAFKKGGFSQYMLSQKNTKLSLFEVDDFVESSDFKTVWQLNGPQIKSSKTKENLLDSANKAAEWLIKNQEVDGNFIPIIDVSGSATKQVDWLRSALSGWALAELGRNIENQKYTEAALKNFRYLKRLFLDENYRAPQLHLILSYLGQEALTLNKINEATECAKRIRLLAEKAVYEPIPFQQMASFLARYAQSVDFKFISASMRLAGFVKKKFDFSWQNENDSARYAELVNTYFNLFKVTENRQYLKFADEILKKLLRFRKNGSFELADNFLNPSTRGVGKIFEILSLNNRLPDELRFENKFGSLNDRLGQWLTNMQYDYENIFFVHPDMREKIVGGFRHDMGNPSVWIDSAAHFILGVSRLFFKDKDDLRLDNQSLKYFKPLKFSKELIDVIPAEHKYFFEKKFILEDWIIRIALKMISFLKSDFDQRESFINRIEGNKIIRNYKYLLNFLIQKGVLKDSKLEDLFLYKFFNNIPGFFAIDPMTIQMGSIKNNFYAHGFSKKWSRALNQAFGEVLERYSYNIYEKNQMIKKSINQLKNEHKKFVDLNHITSFSKEQRKNYPERQWNNDSLFFWEEVFRYKNDEKKLIPSQLIYWNYSIDKDEKRLRESNTSGLGGFFNKEEAILSALYELVERDSFFYYWLNSKKPTRIDPLSIPDEEFKKNYKEAIAAGFEMMVFYTPTNIKIPSTFVILHDKSLTGPCYVLGGGCNPDVIKAINRSLEEAWSIYYWSRSKFKGSYDEFSNQMDEAQLSIDKRISIWSNRNMEGKLDFFVSENQIDFSEINFDDPANFSSKKEELKFAIEMIEKLGEGYEVYVHLNKHEILKKLNYFSARVIVPKLLVMYYNEKNIATYSERVEGEANKLLHLFP